MSGGGSSGAGAGGEAEVSSAVLSAPPGWTKKVTPLKGGTPKRKEIIFVAPTGEELSSKRQVEKYLKSHPGGPDLSEFYWGSGETPRRSARLKTKEVDTPESEPPKKRSRKSLEKKGDDTETEAALEEQGDDVQMHDTEAAVTEAGAEVKAVEETPELNKIDDFRAPVAPSGEAAPVAPSGEAAPVAPSGEADVVKESLHDDSVETKKDDTVAEGTTEEILISENMPLSGDTEVAVKDDTKNGKASEDTQVKVDINVQEYASNEQQVKVDCPEVVVGEKDEVVVGEKDVARETEHVGWTREIQVEDGNLPSSTLFDDKKEGDSGPAADTAPKVTGNSCISAEDGEVKPQPPQQKYAIDLEQLPAP